MKTVSGRVVSTQPISLSRAAKWISKFTVSDNEAPPAFSAYLMRTSVAFDDLVQLHKQNNTFLGDSGIKMNDKGTGNLKLSQGCVLDVNNLSKKIVPDVGGPVGKKSRKKSETNVSEVKDEMTIPNPNGELKKKKRKIDKFVMENTDVGLETIVHEIQHSPHRLDDGIGEGVCTVQNSRDERKKHKKSKANAEQKDDGNVMKEGKEVMETKVESKDIHELEIRDNECIVETVATDKKPNRKRKQDRVADGELDGSHETVRAKKKIQPLK